MKKIASGVFLLVSILLITVFWTSCTNPSGGGPGSGELKPPSYVEVTIEKGEPVITWDTVDDAEGYYLYKKAGKGKFLDTGIIVSGTEYIDIGGFAGLDIQYAVKSFAGTSRSPLSAPSGVVFVNVQNVWATRFQYGDRIELSWDRHSQADSYNIYRCTSADGSGAEMIGTVANDPNETSFILIDDGEEPHPAAGNTPYWYRVVWVESAVEYGTSGFVSLGIYGDEVDYNEPFNNDYYDLDNQSPIGIGSGSITNYLYSINNGNGSRDDDVDWFRFENPSAAVKVKVVYIISNPVSGEDFEADQISFALREADGSSILLSTTPDDSISDRIIYEFYDLDSNDDFYFMVRAVVGENANVFGKYTIQASYE
jgi:hypothetical protein